MRFSGFEVRDCIQWLYGSGFPKSHNISKALDKIEGAEREIIGTKERGSVEEAKERGVGFLSDPANRNNTKQFGYGTELITAPATQSAKLWDGWGSALKPANEPIVLARKPLEKGLSIAENILKWGVGGINIDATRIGYREDDHVLKYEGYSNGQYKSEYEDGTSYKHGNQVQINTQGRFPANIILTHHPECECKGTKKVKGSNSKPQDIGKGRDGDFTNGIYGAKQSKVATSDTDIEGNEEVEDWDCHEDCPIKILDEQSGVLKSGSLNGDYQGFGRKGVYNENESRMAISKLKSNASIGGASRFFYVTKASKSERNKGLDNTFEKELGHNRFDKCEICNGYIFQNQDRPSACKCESPKRKNNIVNGNFHPTVKPIKLMQYLIKMITPPNGIVLDPFCGSGTTGVACKLEGFQFVGMEQDPEYSKIAESRIKNYKEEKEKTPKNKPKEDKQPVNNQTTLF
jgi:site-specific DNA-methyltransferase (adenine-specific)